MVLKSRNEYKIKLLLFIQQMDSKFDSGQIKM